MLLELKIVAVSVRSMVKSFSALCNKCLIRRDRQLGLAKSCRRQRKGFYLLFAEFSRKGKCCPTELLFRLACSCDLVNPT